MNTNRTNINKIIFLIISVLFISKAAVAAQRPYIISGFDDVLRQAENTGLLKATIKIFEDDKGFAGMSELYQVISTEEQAPRFVLVSAISNWFDTRIDQFLTKSQFPINQRYLRNWLTEWSIESFKIEKIREVLKEKSDRKFIVIFDNSNASIHLSKEIKHQFANHVVAIYLRQVQNKVLPSETIGFYTAFDIAVNEYEKGRLLTEDVLRVANAILAEPDINSIIPSYALCPSDANTCEVTTTEIKDICLKVQKHVQTLCRH